MSYFKVKNLSAGYEKENIVQDIFFELEKGCLMGILGANVKQDLWLDLFAGSYDTKWTLATCDVEGE